MSKGNQTLKCTPFAVLHIQIADIHMKNNALDGPPFLFLFSDKGTASGPHMGNPNMDNFVVLISLAWATSRLITHLKKKSYLSI